MFIHNFKYTFKTLFRNKMLIFWTFAFPIILGTFFNMAFSNIENSEKLEIIDIAIVNNDEFKNASIWQEVFKTLSDEKKQDQLFNTKYVTIEEAEQLLKNGDIIGYMVLKEEKPNLVFTTNGIEQTVFKQIIEEIMQTNQIVSFLSENEIRNEMLAGHFVVDYEKIYRDVTNTIQNQEINIKDISSSNLSYTMIEFYTLIAMSCLYGGILGMVAINQNLANMSHQGKRVSISPTSKWKVVLSSILAGYVTHLIGLAILFIYTIFALKVEYGANLPLIILLGIVGSFAGLSMGVMIGSAVKANENLKTGILISVTMLGCFLSGMMGITMKYVIDKNLPIVNKMNPANMITDGFYALYYYNTQDRYFFNIISLLIFAIIVIMISYLCLRRQKYDNI